MLSAAPEGSPSSNVPPPQMGGPGGKWVLGGRLPGYDSSTTATATAGDANAAVDHTSSEQHQHGLRPPQEQHAGDEKAGDKLPMALRLRGDTATVLRNAQNSRDSQQQQQRVVTMHTASQASPLNIANVRPDSAGAGVVKCGSNQAASISPPPEIRSPVPVEGASVGEAAHRGASSAVDGLMAPREEQRSSVAGGAGTEGHVGVFATLSSSDFAPSPLFSNAQPAVAQPSPKGFSMKGAATAPWERHTRGFGTRILRVSASGKNGAEKDGERRG